MTATLHDSLHLIKHRHANAADIGCNVGLIAAHYQVISRHQRLRHVVKVKEDVFTGLSANQETIVLGIVEELELTAEQASLGSMWHLHSALLLHVLWRVSLSNLAGMKALLECQVGPRSLTVRIVLVVLEHEIELRISVVSGIVD